MWIVVLCLTLTFSSQISVDPETNMFVDTLGRERFFHGLNVIQKGSPYYPPYEGFNVNTTFSDIDMAKWQEWGFNAVRLGVEWVGLEPEQGKLDMEYLENIKKIVDMASGYGIYTLLDMHQDSYSEKFCGEGFPLWASKNLDGIFGLPMPLGLPFKTGPDHVPTKEQCDHLPWGWYQIMFSGAHAYQSLYDNVDGIQDAFGDFWGNVSAAFVGNDGVLGYELMNEPFMGNLWLDLLELTTGYTDYHYLQPMYENLQKKVRAQDPDTILFFESITTDSSFKQTGFTQVPGGDAYQNRSALSFHYYDPPNSPNVAAHMHSRREDTRRLRTGGMLTEYDISSLAANQPGGNWTTGFEATPSGIVRTADTCDENLFSWLGWEYKIFHPITGASYSIYRPDGTINHPYLATLTRTYPQIVAGRTQGFSFNNSTAEFWLNYTATSTSCMQNSTVYLHELYHYPDGFQVDFVKGDGLFEAVKARTNYVDLVPTRDVTEGIEISVHITRK